VPLLDLILGCAGSLQELTSHLKIATRHRLLIAASCWICNNIISPWAFE